MQSPYFYKYENICSPQIMTLFLAWIILWCKFVTFAIYFVLKFFYFLLKIKNTVYLFASNANIANCKLFFASPSFSLNSISYKIQILHSFNSIILWSIYALVNIYKWTLDWIKWWIWKWILSIVDLKLNVLLHCWNESNAIAILY